MAKIFKPAKGTGKKRSGTQRSSVLTLTVDNIDNHGQGVARQDSGVVFVESGLLDEVVKAKIVEQKSRYTKATVTQVIEPSPHRIVPECEYFGQCGGCQTQHCQPQAMLQFKQQAIEQLIMRTAITAPKTPGAQSRLFSELQPQLHWHQAITGDPWAYRRKVRLSVDARNPQRPLLGLRKSASKQIVPIEHCGILTPSLNRLIAPLQTLFSAFSLPGGVGHISLFDAQPGCQITCRVVKTLPKSDRERLVEFGKQHNCEVLLEDNQGDFESLTQGPLEIQYGLNEKVDIAVGPNDFVQVNSVVNQQMVEQAIQWLDLGKTDHVLDLFAGVGNFSLAMAGYCQTVIGVEGVPKMVQRASANAQLNGIDNCQFVQGDLSQPSNKLLKSAGKCNKILLDPAREGAAFVMEDIAKLQPQRVVYVSCNPNTFARDAARLLSRGYRIQQIALMDMFPQTAHTELMALFVPLASYQSRH